MLTWKEFVSQLILELGGEALIFLAICRYLGNSFAERLTKKYNLKLNQELENYKNLLSNKSYVSKTKYDKLVDLCSIISEKLFLCFDKIKKITPKNEVMENLLEVEDIVLQIDDLQEIIIKSIPLISDELYTELNNVVTILKKQIQAYKNIRKNTEDTDINFISIQQIEKEEKNIFDLLRKTYEELEVTSN